MADRAAGATQVGAAVPAAAERPLVLDADEGPQAAEAAAADEDPADKEYDSAVLESDDDEARGCDTGDTCGRRTCRKGGGDLSEAVEYKLPYGYAIDNKDIHRARGRGRA